jgi:hypothetical protein
LQKTPRPVIFEKSEKQVTQMQILTATIVITGSNYILTIPDSKGQAPVKVGEGKLTTYQIEKELFKSGSLVAFKPGKSPYLVSPAEALGVAAGTVKSVDLKFTPSGAGIYEVKLDRDGGFAKIKFSNKLPIKSEILEGSKIEAVGVASAYLPADAKVGYVSIWASSVEVSELVDF